MHSRQIVCIWYFSIYLRRIYGLICDLFWKKHDVLLKWMYTLLHQGRICYISINYLCSRLQFSSAYHITKQWSTIIIQFTTLICSTNLKRWPLLCSCGKDVCGHLHHTMQSSLAKIKFSQIFYLWIKLFPRKSFHDLWYHYTFHISTKSMCSGMWFSSEISLLVYYLVVLSLCKSGCYSPLIWLFAFIWSLISTDFLWWI